MYAIHDARKTPRVYTNTPQNSPALIVRISLVFSPSILSAVYFDYEDDMVMAERRGNFLSLTNQDGLLFMRQRGYEHVQAMEVDGKLDCIRGAALPSPKQAIVSDR